MAQFQMNMLEKTEELVLYTFQQEEKLQAQHLINEELEACLEVLEQASGANPGNSAVNPLGQTFAWALIVGLIRVVLVIGRVLARRS